LVHSKALLSSASLTSKYYRNTIGDDNQRIYCRRQIPQLDDRIAWARRKGVQTSGPIEDESESVYASTKVVLTDEAIQHPSLYETKIAAVESVLNPARMKFRPRVLPQGHIPDALDDFAFIDDVSYAFGLKIRQHVAFVSIAKALLLRWRHEMRSDDDDEMIKQSAKVFQLRMVLHGEGGTGKSHILKAVDAFTSSWKRPGSVATTAMTGKAACAINGSTFHSWLGMHHLDSAKVHEAHHSMSKGIAGFSDCLGLLVIDEVLLTILLHTYNSIDEYAA
jgi:hypothetical protein